MYDLIRIRGSLRVLHSHGVLKKIYLRQIHTRHFTDCLLHMGTAGAAAHTGHIELLLHLSFCSPFACPLYGASGKPVRADQNLSIPHPGVLFVML